MSTPGPGAGWYWRWNMGGSGHYVPGAEPAPGGYSLWVATASSPCGQAQGPSARGARGSELEDPVRRPVYWEHACTVCRAYCARHGLPLPPGIDRELTSRLQGIGYDQDGATRLLADLRSHGLDLVLRS